MALFRKVHTSFWSDPDIEDWTPEEKYFYLYLMTNPHTNPAGIYEISKRQMAYETGYNKETIEKLLNRFTEYRKIAYNSDTNEIAIRNWLKHNSTKSPKLITCIKSALSRVKDKSLIDQLNYTV